jgi:hypothetical protein
MNLPCVFKTKHHAPIPPSSTNGVKFYEKETYAHMVLPLFFMAICDFTPDLEYYIYIVFWQNN